MGNLTLNELGKRAFDNAEAKGFHDSPVDIPRNLMLITSELAEAMEADRRHKWANLADFHAAEDVADNTGTTFRENFENHIKDTFEDELADAAIRLVELATRMGIDLDTHIRLKMQYNEGREYKHGKLY